MRDACVLALRLLGIWLLVESVTYFTGTILSTYAILSQTFGTAGDEMRQLVVIWSQFFAYAAMAILLLRYAPAITALFYGREPSALAARPNRTTAVAWGKVLARLLGIYTLIYAVSPLAWVLYSIYGGRASSTSYREQQLIALVTYLALSGILIFYGGQIMTRLAARDRRGRLQDEAYEQQT